MDTVYLKTNFGECLTHCLTEVSEKRPRDPVEYIAQWLYKYIENQKHAAAVSIWPQGYSRAPKNYVGENAYTFY